MQSMCRLLEEAEQRCSLLQRGGLCSLTWEEGSTCRICVTWTEARLLVVDQIADDLGKVE